MKPLSKACEPILTTAKETTAALVPLPNSSSGGSGKTTILPPKWELLPVNDNTKLFLAQCKSSLGLSIQPKTLIFYDEKYGASFHHSHQLPSDITPEQRQGALDILLEYFDPLPDALILEGLGRLMLVCAGRDRNDADKHATLLFYAKELHRFPADVTYCALFENCTSSSLVSRF